MTPLITDNQLSLWRLRTVSEDELQALLNVGKVLPDKWLVDKPGTAISLAEILLADGAVKFLLKVSSYLPANKVICDEPEGQPSLLSLLSDACLCSRCHLWESRVITTRLDWKAHVVLWHEI